MEGKSSQDGVLAFRWRNFRGFLDTGWVALRPITVLIGPNNAGKTSLLLPLLLLKQTHASPQTSSALVTRGEFANVGSYEEFVHNAAVDKDIVFSFQFRPEHHTAAPQKMTPGTTAFVHSRFGRSAETGEPVLKRYSIADQGGHTVMVRSRSPKGHYPVTQLPVEDSFLTGRRKPKGQSVARRIHDAIADEAPMNFLFSGVSNTGLIGELLQSATRAAGAQRTEVSKYADAFARYATVVAESAIPVLRLLSGIDYLGPIRERPSRIYELSGEPPSDVGVTGKYAPEVLHRQAGRSLIEAVDSWLERFGFRAHVLTTKPVGGAFSLKFQRGKSVVNFADTGFGMSQLLPLIVQGIVSRPGNLLIAEQPEIHLNPRLQTALADLYVAFARDGKRALIETHSEHVLLRLRRLVAEGTLRSTDLAVYYLGPRHESRPLPIPVDEMGQITGEWPSGFFEESLREALGLANAQARVRAHG